MYLLAEKSDRLHSKDHMQSSACIILCIYKPYLNPNHLSFSNILALLLFENLQRIYLNSRLNGTQSKDVKWGVGVEGASFHGFVNDESL